MRSSRIHRLYRPIAALSAALLSIAVLAQTKTATYDVSNVRVTAVALGPLADGGCAARWCGYVVSSEDGGSAERACTAQREFGQAANQNRCAQLAAAGVNRLARELDLDVDAGSQ